MSRDHSAPIVSSYRPKPPGAERNARRLAWILVGAGAAAAALWLGLSSRGERPLSSWTEATASVGPIREIAQVSGSVEMTSSRNVLAPEAGTLTVRVVAEGDWVARGGTLAYMESADLEDELEAAVSGIASAERELAVLDADRGFALERAAIETARKRRAVADAETALARARELEAAGAGTAKETADRDRDLVEAREALALDELSAREAAHGYEYKRATLVDKLAALEADRVDLAERIRCLAVASPLGGRVLSWKAEEGDPVQRNGALASVADTTRPIAVFAVPETTAPRLAVGMKVTITVGSSAYAGTIAAIGREATASSDYGSTVSVTASFDGEPPEFAAGATAGGSIVMGSKDSAVLLPRGPYLSSGGAKYLFVIEGNRAIRVPAQFGSTEGTMVEVLTGAEEGDRILTSDYGDIIDMESVELGGKQ